MGTQSWKLEYPYTLDLFLLNAIKEASDNDDETTAKKIWEVFISYRKSEYQKAVA